MSSRPTFKKNLILIGFMGTGKSSVAKLSAQSLGFEFIDTDEVVESLASKSISEIFEEDGEEAFRLLETEALACVSENEGQVIATGGGIVTQPRNIELLSQSGYVVWLRASAEIVYERVRHNRNRPLLQTEDPQETIREMMEQRSALYESASDIEIDTSGLTIDETVHGITETARFALG